MKKMKSNLWILSIVLFSVSALTAQDDGFSSVRNQGYYTLGLNTGFSYLSSDVKNQYNGYGVGLTLAKNLYYQPGATFTFDARGRLMYDESYGLDFERSFAIENNDALNGTGKLDYTLANGESGFVYNNFRTRKAELAAEGVLHLNRLREKTRFDVSLYGGLGLDWYKVKTDQQNSSGNYDYSEIDPEARRSTIRTQLKNNILDGVYETNAHSFKNAGKLGFMPNVGFDVEYNLTKRFSIGVGHKITFPRNDNLDGQLWNRDGTVSANKDLHHYTNLDLRWILSPYQKKLKAPIIDVTRPNRSPHTASYCEGDVRATIKYVRNAADVNFKVNGQPTAYEFRGESFKANFPLKPGRNEVKIYAQNTAGSDQETVIIFCEEVTAPPPPAPPVVYKPTVKITSPSYNDYTTRETSMNIKANVENITLKSDIEFYVNGSRKSFNFDPRSSRLDANINLTNGRNIVKIVARNSAGQDQDDRTIIVGYTEASKPTIFIKSPSADPYETTGSRVNVSAITKHVDRKSDIDLIVNGRGTTDFSFNTSREKIEATVYLEPGRNTIEVRVKNESGTATDRTAVIYVQEQYEEEEEEPDYSGLKPTVEFSRPSTSSSNTSEATAIVKAFVRKVDSKNNIRFTLNGSPHNFTYNASSQIVMTTVSLQQGRNTIEISGTNNYGTASEDISIRRLSAITNIAKKPDVDITKPNNNSTTTSKNATVKAKVKEVAGKEEIKLTLNGNNISNFSYNKLTRELSANVTLKAGSNTIKVVATNNRGTDSDQVKVTVQTISKPAVRITTPKNNTTVSKSSVSLKSTVSNVTSKNDIKVILNGKNISNFNYSNGNVTATMILKTGKNTIKVKGTNSAGSAEARTIVTFSKPAPVPTPAPVAVPKITVISPKGSTSNSNKVSLKAKVVNVRSKSDIKMTLNGKNYTSFSYAPSTKLLTATLKLKSGTNKIGIVATNSSGVDKENISIKYLTVNTVPIARKKPVVTINSIGQPTADPFNPGPLKSTILATVKLVTQKSQITLRVNGEKVTDFTYDSSKGTVRHTFLIKDGTNSIRIEATNKVGTTLVTKNHNF